MTVARTLRADFPQAGEAIPLPRSPQAWREALNRWLDPAKREAAREDVAGLAAAYSLDRNVRETVELLERLNAQNG